MWGGSVRGPAAPPGAYKVRLTTGEQTLEQDIDIAIDPRVSIAQVDYDKRFELLIAIRDGVRDAHDAINQIRNIRKQADAAVGRVKQHAGDSDDVAEAANALKEKLSAIEEELIQTRSKSRQDPLNFPIKLNNKIAALAGGVSRGDAAPTAQARAVLDDLSARLQMQLDKLAAIVDADVPAFNALVKKADVPAIILESKQ